MRPKNIKHPAIILLSLSLIMGVTFQAHSFFSGAAQVMYLARILTQSIQQLTQLKNVVGSAKDQLNLVRDINRGIDSALDLAGTMSNSKDPGVYRELTKINRALSTVEDIYGKSSGLKNAKALSLTDKTVAEAISLNNSLYKYAGDVDQIGEKVKQRSKVASPGGAQRLTSQSMGVMLHMQGQNLRAQSTGIKLQAQQLALENRREKEKTKQIQSTAESVEKAFKEKQSRFELPKF